MPPSYTADSEAGNRAVRAIELACLHDPEVGSVLMRGLVKQLPLPGVLAGVARLAFKVGDYRFALRCLARSERLEGKLLERDALLMVKLSVLVGSKEQVIKRCENYVELHPDANPSSKVHRLLGKLSDVDGLKHWRRALVNEAVQYGLIKEAEASAAPKRL
jgi:hypothetical protein